MNRRALLKLIGLAPVAAPMVARGMAEQSLLIEGVALPQHFIPIGPTFPDEELPGLTEYLDRLQRMLDAGLISRNDALDMGLLPDDLLRIGDPDILAQMREHDLFDLDPPQVNAEKRSRIAPLS